VEPLIPFFPMPGGALTANTQMLRDSNLMDKYPEVVAAMGEAVSKGGFGTSVTPVSQFYFQQAFNNVMFGPWQKMAPGYGKMVLGYFGKTPVAPDPEIIGIAREQLKLEPTTESPLDINDRNPDKGIPACKKTLEAEGLPVTDENLFIVASCAEKGVAFLKGKGVIGVRKGVKKEETVAVSSAPSTNAAVKNNEYIITISGKTYNVKVENAGAVVNGPNSEPENEARQASAPVKEDSGAAQSITSPLPGLVLRIEKKAGDTVKENEAVMIVESMKMETPIYSPLAGKVVSIDVAPGQQIQVGTVVAKVK
jgi:pyruvate carboxylase subunit B